jgi:hypothetical protein
MSVSNCRLDDMQRQLDETIIKDNYSATTGGTGPQYISKKYLANVKYWIYVKTETLGTATAQDIGLYFKGVNIYSGQQIKQLTAAQLYEGYEFEYIPQVDGYFGLRTHEVGINFIFSIVCYGIPQLSEECSRISENQWKDKNVVIYGDSVTAQGNGDNPGNDSFMYWAAQTNKFANLYARGIGGQTFKWNTNGWYCKAQGGNGNYVDRYKYNAQGQQLSEVVSPVDITQEEIANIEAHYGYEIEVHYGAFCSWDRIKTMIPESIRNTIDLVILCGGSNDFSSVSENSLAEPTWVENDATDPTWANDSP